jgi:DNA-directed RNA polymerase specialized sigma24 family protein
MRQPETIAGHSAGDGAFAATHWSLVFRAADFGSDARAAAALEELCRAYWYPLYVFARRSGCDAPAAEDATQEFFAGLLQNGLLHRADPARGRFRSFLIGAMKHHLTDRHRRDHAQRRGGCCDILSLESLSPEDRYRMEPADETTSPEAAFDKRWAHTLLERTLSRLRAECDAEGRAERYDSLKVFLLPAGGQPPIPETARSLGMAETALKAAIHRLRERFRKLFRDEVLQTVADENEVDQELRYVVSLLV